MKRFVLIGLVILGGVLAACSQDSEATLQGLGYAEVPVVTDVEGLVEPLGRSADVHFVPTEKLASVVAEQGVGVVSYTPVPDIVWIDLKEFYKKLKLIYNQCGLILCDRDGNPVPDPRLGGLVVGFDFTAVYATPELLERVAGLGYGADALSAVSVGELTQVVAETGLRVANVGRYIPSPGSPWEGRCQQRPVPHVCKLISAGGGLEVDTLDTDALNEHLGDFGLVVVDYSDLRHVELAGELVQLHGKGLKPLFSALQVGAPERVGEQAALSLMESLFSEEGQRVLTEAGIIPVTQRAYADAVADDVAGHVENAFEFGQLSAPPESF